MPIAPFKVYLSVSCYILQQGSLRQDTPLDDKQSPLSLRRLADQSEVEENAQGATGPSTSEGNHPRYNHLLEVILRSQVAENWYLIRLSIL